MHTCGDLSRYLPDLNIAPENNTRMIEAFKCFKWRQK